MSIRGPLRRRSGAGRPCACPTSHRRTQALGIDRHGPGVQPTFIDGSALGVALPAIQGDLGAGPAAVQWISNAYLLMLGALVLIGGAGGGRFGRRRIFLIGVNIFALASVACGLAPTVELLIGGRALQGIGASLLQPRNSSLSGKDGGCLTGRCGAGRKASNAAH